MKNITNKQMKKYDPTITVCSKCLRACCWQGEFMCDDSRYASTVERKISTLVKLDNGNTEHPFWWNRDLYTANKRLLTRENLMELGVNDENMLDLEDDEISKDYEPESL